MSNTTHTTTRTINCKTCGIETINKVFCSQRCNTVRPHNFETESFCRNCQAWKPKCLRCDECKKPVSNKARYTKNKNPDRWAKAY